MIIARTSTSAKNVSTNTPKLVRKRVRSLKPSPENEKIYRPTYTDPRIDNLADAIKKNGCTPLTITKDNYVVSGHRRLAALELINRAYVECYVLPKNRADYSEDEYLRLLADHNEQREKSVDEMVREELVRIDAKDSHKRLEQRRLASTYSAAVNKLSEIQLGGPKLRHAISEDKAEHVRLIKEIVFGPRKAYWPLSVRSVHYQLLNYDFVRGFFWPKRTDPDYGVRRELKYKNDDQSYNATSDLVTRLRLNGTIPWEAFDDQTRPFKDFPAFCDVREFVRQETERLYDGYWRNLVQSQPNHIEVVVEKNTVYHMALQVTQKYQIPTSSARGFSSIDVWHDVHQRYLASGKERLIIICLADFDPEGQRIPISAGEILRDDFGVFDSSIIKAGVTREQIDAYKLPSMNFAKESSSNYDWFCAQNNGDDNVYELEALDPKVMLDDLEAVIRKTIDLPLFELELEQEEQDSAYLEAMRMTVQKAIKGVSM